MSRLHAPGKVAPSRDAAVAALVCTTADRGWVRAGTLHVGEAVVTADGATATVVALRVVAGVAAMWDLMILQVHTFIPRGPRQLRCS